MAENDNPQLMLSPLTIVQPKPAPLTAPLATPATASSSTAKKKRVRSDTDTFKTSAVKCMKVMVEKRLIDNPGDEANFKLVIDKYIELNTDFDSAVCAGIADVMATARALMVEKGLWEQRNKVIEQEQKEAIAAANASNSKSKENIAACERQIDKIKIMGAELQEERAEVLRGREKILEKARWWMSEAKKRHAEAEKIKNDAKLSKEKWQRRRVERDLATLKSAAKPSS